MATDPKPMPRASSLTVPPAGRKLSEMSADINVVPPVLDLVHMTDAGSAREIILGGFKKLEARHCAVLQDRFVFCFLARPDYRKLDWEQEAPYVASFPAAFVLANDGKPPASHVYAFDTGAAASGRFAAAANSKVRLEDYRLDDAETARRHIAHYFGDNANYFDGLLRRDLPDDRGNEDWINASFMRIAQLPGSGANRPDLRASAIEFAFNTDVPLQGKLRLMVLPRPFATGYADFHAALAKLGAPTLEYYDWKPDRTPASYLPELRGIVERHLRAQGQL